MKVSFLAVVGLAIVCGYGCATASKPGAASAMPDPFKMNQRLGRGVNLGNALDAPKEGDWGVVLTNEYFDLVKQAGFDSIRLPVRWSAHAMTNAPYTIDADFMQRVDWAISNALSRNLPIVLDIHHFMEAYTDPNGQKEKFGALWKQIAEHYKAYPDLLLFELFNEPKKKMTDGYLEFLHQGIAAHRSPVQSEPDHPHRPGGQKHRRTPQGAQDTQSQP